MSAVHTDKIKNIAKKTLPRLFVTCWITLRKISLYKSNQYPDPVLIQFFKMNIQIQSWSEKIASILQDIQSWSCPCSPLSHISLWRNCRMRAKSESSQPCPSESIASQVTCGRCLLKTEAPLLNATRFVSARFATICDLDEISQLGSSRWHSRFCIYYVTIPPTSIWRVRGLMSSLSYATAAQDICKTNITGFIYQHAVFAFNNFILQALHELV